jgi:ribosomal protein S18 acetylase RimI-like enzyme
MARITSRGTQPSERFTDLLVHPSWRRKGIGRAMMMALENEARAAGKTLLVLDTREGDSSNDLYRALGYREAGRIPG